MDASEEEWAQIAAIELDRAERFLLDRDWAALYCLNRVVRALQSVPKRPEMRNRLETIAARLRALDESSPSLPELFSTLQSAFVALRELLWEALAAGADSTEEERE
ncbi:MAG: hypothetical protein KatS3mg115_2083 [Candidatus Poribacteria bacterium]|nr:MAG: hypothetical protein KatS3mg115_2083 [Candidatus Poribacteria bacterium]